MDELELRWERLSQKLPKEDQNYGELYVHYAKKHSSDAFHSCNDPLEGAICSALVEILKRLDEIERAMKNIPE